MLQLLSFMETNRNIPINKVESDIFDKELIVTFLEYLEVDRGLSISSKNQRLAALHSFFKYLMMNDIECYDACRGILDIEFARKPQIIMNYLSVDEIKLLLAVPDYRSKKGIRDLCILATLYETASRVQELINIKFCDVTLCFPSVILLHGKGNKDRFVPISKDVTSIVLKYINVYGIRADDYLFQNAQGNELTRNGVQYIINKNIWAAKKLYPKYFNGKITNHTFRHSKSMHLLEAGVNLIYIRDFLGHTSVSTTEIYAKANAEIKRKAIEQHSLSLKNKAEYAENEKEMLVDWLKTQF